MQNGVRQIYASNSSEFDPEAVLQKSIPHSFDVQPITNALISRYSTVHGNSCVLYYYNVNGHQNS